MSVSFGNVAANADEACTITKQTGELSDQGGLVMQSAIQEISKIAEAVNDAYQLIRAPGDDYNRISTIVLTIKEFADQTTPPCHLRYVVLCAAR